ncbi:zinc metalloproteinase nas-14-like isoform X1 [Anopheles funestus]|uniref:zinc metalloproteinase nas-14-like isoform X1 n=1 Tax=Anopheles funestus TaxID=62324 RepID=UPI0020C605EC|nr:zinc metalloproteinase nas-14-like isoform X1 [Anopheles funestus]
MKVLLVSLCVVFVLFLDTTTGRPAKRTSPISLEGDNVLEEIGGHFEGDMILSPEQSNAVKNGYTALTNLKKWPNGIVYYTIDTTVFTAAQQSNIRTAMDQIELVTCVRFVPRTDQKGYTFISVRISQTLDMISSADCLSFPHVYYQGTAASSCSSYLGHHGGQQKLTLQPNGCTGVGTVIHELLHTLGFAHAQSASDRDFYIDINYNAIQDGAQNNFILYNSSLSTDFGIPYDYDSIMHYGKLSFSKDGQPTIIPKKHNAIIGQRNGLSVKDIKRINHQYPDCY